MPSPLGLRGAARARATRQAAGELSPTLSPDWISAVLGAMIVAAVQEIAARRLDPSEAPAIVTATVLHGISGAETAGSSLA